MRRLVSVFQRSVEAFFPKSKYIVSTGYLFLRVIVPYVTSPDGFGCYHRPIEQSGRRNLILVGKVLQNLANDALFGAKEAYMVGMNPFMGAALPLCQRYISDLGRALSAPEEVCSSDDRSTIEDQMRLHRMLLKVRGCSACFCAPHHHRAMSHLISLQNLSKLQRAQNLKVALDSMQPPPENVRLHHIVPFIWLRYLSFCFCLQSSLHIRTDDPCSQVKQVEKNARASIVFTHPPLRENEIAAVHFIFSWPHRKNSS